MAKKKKEQKVSISQGDEAQARTVLEQYHTLAGKLRSSKDQQQAEEALSTVSGLPEAAQMALLKALSREYHHDAADLLVAINALSPLKSVRKEARRSLLRLEEARIYPRWEPPIERLSPVDAIQMQSVNSMVTDLVTSIEESENPPRFWKGFVTDTRDIGEVDLLLMWEQGNKYKDVLVLGFLLELWHEGIKDFFSRVESKRSAERLIEHTKGRLKVVDCSLAEARRLIKEALAVNKQYGTPIYKDFRASLPLVNKLVLENPDIVDEEEEEDVAFEEKEEDEEDDENEISPDLEPFEVVTNFVEDWADEEYADAYNYLASQSRLREGLTQEEWAERREEWAEKAHPDYLKPNFIHEREVKKSGLWLPNPFSRGAANAEKVVDAGWSIELVDTPEMNQLPELPQATDIYEETGRHWFWSSYRLVEEPDGWRILDMVDEGKNAQDIPAAELQKLIKQHNEQVQKIMQQHSPSDPDALKYLNEILWRTMQVVYYEDALLKQEPPDHTTYFEAAARAAILQDEERSITYLERIIQQFPEQRAEALRQIGALQLELSEKYEDEEGDDERAEHFRELAEASLRESLTIEDHATGHIGLADVLQNIGGDEKLDEAEDELLKAQALTTDKEAQAIIESKLGELAMDRDDYEDALKHYQRVEEIDPTFPGTKASAGDALREMGNTEEAMVAFRQAIETEPDNLHAYVALSEMYQEEGEESMAQEVLEEGIAANPNTVELHLLLAASYIQKNDFRRAEELVDEAESINPLDENVQMYKQVLAFSKTLSKKLPPLPPAPKILPPGPAKKKPKKR
jgi:tetratricopeptide (TPR) repeat protein